MKSDPSLLLLSRGRAQTFNHNLTTSIDQCHGIPVIELILTCTWESHITSHSPWFSVLNIAGSRISLYVFPEDFAKTCVSSTCSQIFHSKTFGCSTQKRIFWQTTPRKCFSISEPKIYSVCNNFGLHQRRAKRWERDKSKVSSSSYFVHETSRFKMKGRKKADVIKKTHLEIKPVVKV